MIGKKLAHYEVTGLLGKGGMGEVYVARDTRLDREVALKVIPPELADDAERRQRFEREAKTVAALRHPNIVTLHSIEEFEGTRFLTMELVDGVPLSSRVRPGGMGLNPLLDIAIPLADAVGAAHARGITHRDLKPANILIDDQGRVMVLDFGVAKLAATDDGVEADATRVEVDSLTQQGNIVGTVHYMSPEQAEGKPVDPRSDVFSLGILLYELATGEKPYTGDSALSVLSSILKDEPVPVTERNLALPRQIGRILKRCLEKDAARRFPTATDLRIELEALREEVTGSMAAATATRRAASIDASKRGSSGGLPVSPRRLTVGLAIAAVAILALVAGQQLSKKDHTPTNAPSLTANDTINSAPGVGASGRPSIAVFRFEDHTGDEEIRWLGSGLPNMLLTGLAQTPGLDVVSSQRIDDILEQIGREDAEKIDRQILDAMAEQSGAGAVVVGSIFKSGDTIRIDVQVDDVATGRILFARNATGSEVFSLVDQLASEIRKGLDLTAPAETAPLAAVSSTNLEAWRAYQEGEQARKAFRLADALDAYHRALQLDPDFAIVHLRLSGVNSTLGRDDEADREANRTYELIDRLPPRQRGLVEADRAAQDDKDYPRAVAILEDIINRFPDEIDAYIQLRFVQAVALGDPQAACATLEHGVMANPQSPELRNAYGYGLRDLGRYADAIRELEAYQRLEPNEANPLDSLGELYLVAGQPERSIENYSRALAMDPDFMSSYVGRGMALANLGRYDETLDELDQWQAAVERRGLDAVGIDAMRKHVYMRLGRFDEAEAAGRRVVALSERISDDTSLPRMELLATEIAFARGDYEACARASRQGVAKMAPSDDPFRGSQFAMFYELESIALARLGRHQRARELADELDAYPQHRATAFMPDWLRANAELAEGHVDRAEALFQKAQPVGKGFYTGSAPVLQPMLRIQNPVLRDWEAQILVARGDLAGAVAKYQQLNRPGIENICLSTYDPLYVLEVARLYDRMGDRPGATEAYTRFLEDWKNADPGRPEVVEAQEYLKGSRG